MSKTTLKTYLTLACGIVLGVFLVSNLDTGLISSIFASGKPKLGADKSPVQMSPAMKVINESFVAASDAVLPSVVSINVEAEMKGGGGSMGRDLDEFFKFFGPFGGENFREREGSKDSEKPRTRGAGSGVVISNDGYIITNNHVVENAVDNGIKVILYDKREFTAELIGTDPATDLAVLKIKANDLKPAHFANINSVKVGEFAIAVGNPLGLNSTVTSGIISAIGRGRIGTPRRADFSVEYFIQTDAAINPGNSGGGLFNLDGSLIGINTAIATETGTFMGYGFAIPVDLVQSVVTDLIEDGKINRGFIGVEITSVRDEIEAKAYGLDRPNGVIIQKVREDGAGVDAGLEQGDVIVEIDGKQVKTSEELQSQVVLRRAGDKIKLTIVRDGKKIFKTVTLKANKKDEDLAESKPAQTGADEPIDDSPFTFENLGFSVKPLDNKTKRELEIKSGVLISDVKRYGAVAQRGMAVGGVIIKADRKDVRTSKDLQSILDSKSVGEAVLLHVKYKDITRMISIEIPKKNG
jgi:serine protease Do